MAQSIFWGMIYQTILVSLLPRVGVGNMPGPHKGGCHGQVAGEAIRTADRRRALTDPRSERPPHHEHSGDGYWGRNFTDLSIGPRGLGWTRGEGGSGLTFCPASDGLLPIARRRSFSVAPPSRMPNGA